MARKNAGPKTDMRVTVIRYHMRHPKLPRTLSFARNRHLRHWTIHRAWQLHQAKLRRARKLELERQFNSMAAACEHLRLMDGNGLTAADRTRLGVTADPGKSEGRLFRTAMQKNKIWDNVPIEYARIQTDTPPKDGWNSVWTR
ncbi:hypothetical protein K470DRAFT_258439 [Piedraia hortae CBS 480.64]|uniref:Uncharacterized protein n=1 Tax=Piedraia hortae CBS 480.64 TaxID=1314780 RepID=A0A6A7BX24_9PEZI|nr:hypothetical protein K470DRAFT_258439 [Piedraia hortae CBS 480.64]